MRLLFLFLLSVFALSMFGQINIWEGTNCHKRVELTPYIVGNKWTDSLRADTGVCLYNGNVKDSKGVVVCPGGSYFWHDMETEGHDVARWLQRHGIAAFVLRYRTAYVPAFMFHHRMLFCGNRYPDPQDDLRQALRHVRANAAGYGVNPDSIGVMGFSAGGHLVMSAAELFPKEERPAFVAPIYPVVSMTAECTHRRSRRGLLGDSRTGNTELCDLLSLERHVPKDCPPVFLVNCKDDPVVDYRNSVLLDSALTAQGIAHKYIQYSTGGHGFGASDTKGTAECRQWKTAFLDWLSDLRFED
jgi:acetyl esterase/lipase